MSNPKKDSKPTSRSTIQINRRDGGKKKPDLFANLRNREHPLDDLFPTPSIDTIPSENLDSQTINTEISQSSLDRYPKTEDLDIQAKNIENPNDLALDIQYDKIGYPSFTKLDIQNENLGNPKTKHLETQTELPGNPNIKMSDSLIAKSEMGISKAKGKLDSNKSKIETLDIQKPPLKGKFAKYDAKRQKKGIFLRTDDGITKKFKKFCIENDWDFGQGTEIAWNKLMNDLAIQKDSDLDSKISYDERRMMLTSKTKAPIINLYLAYNSILNPKTKWSIKDDDAGSRLNDVDLRIIELGILQTQAQKNFKGKVHSFTYYTYEIENFLALEIAGETLDVMLKLNRTTWERATGKKLDLSFLDKEREN